MNISELIMYETESKAVSAIQQGVGDLNFFDKYGFRPLIQAVIYSKKHVIHALVNYGADIEQVDFAGRTALQWACDKAKLDLVELLLKLGADPNHSSADGQPILVYPILREQLELVNLLTENGADHQFAQDYISAKLVGHRFELNGEADIVNPKNEFIPLSYEGFYLEFTCGLILRSLNNFVNSIPGRKYDKYQVKLNQIQTALKGAAQLMSYSRHKDKTPFMPVIDTLLDSELIIIPVAYEGHAITFIRYGNLFAKCDRGVNNITDTAIIYQLGNPYAANASFFKDLVFGHNSKSFIDRELKQILALRPIKTLPTKSQIAGNCSWANVEATVPALLYMFYHSEAEQTGASIGQLKNQIIGFYGAWVEWDKDCALEEALQDFHQASQSRQISKATILGTVLAQRCKPDKQSEVRRAKKILQVLATPAYDFILKNLIKVFNTGHAQHLGKKMMTLLKKCGLNLDTLRLPESNTHAKPLKAGSQQGQHQKFIQMTTALHIASLNDELPAVKHLIEKLKIDPNHPDRTGSTALMYASWRGHKHIVKYLLEQGANPKLTNLKGGTALRYAQHAGHDRIVSCLKKWV